MGGRGGGKKSYHAGTLINPLFVKYLLLFWNKALCTSEVYISKN